MKSHEESNDGGGLRGTEIFSVGRHVAAALDDLASKLVLRKEDGDLIEGGTPLAAFVTESMAVVALLELKDERALTHERRAILQEHGGNGIAAPGVHDGTPGSVTSKIGESAENDGDEKNGENGDGTTAPTFFTFTENKRQKQECKNGDDRTDEKSRRLHVRRQQREEGIEPEEKEIGTRSGLDDGGVGTARGAEGTEVGSDQGEREENTSTKEKILVDGAGNKGNAVFLGELVIFLDVGGFANDATGHGPVVDAELEDQQ